MDNEYKQVIVVRRDLGLSKGKLAVQVAHAAVNAYEKTDAKSRSAWQTQGAKKVVVFAEGIREIETIKEKADEYKLPNSLIKDAGRTELPPGTTTALGIGPCESKTLDRITGKLKMV